MPQSPKETAISRLKEILIKDRQAVKDAERPEQAMALRVSPAS